MERADHREVARASGAMLDEVLPPPLPDAGIEEVQRGLDGRDGPSMSAAFGPRFASAVTDGTLV